MTAGDQQGEKGKSGLDDWVGDGLDGGHETRR